MLKLSKKTPPAVGAIIVDMAQGLHTLYDSRNIMISGMSGYPSAIHVIGRLQRLIDTTSYSALLSSLIKIRDIARVTADVIDSMEGVKTDRYQINRTEIIAYVDNVTSSVSSIVLKDEDKDLIANIITSFEANTGSWILSGADDDTNLHVRMRKLYKSIDAMASGALPVYNPHEDSVSTITSLPNFSDVKKKSKTKTAEEVAKSDSKLTSAEVFYKYAAIRILDHIYSLMMDHDIWYAFVSPRTKAEVSANLERSKSLKVLSLYLQSLLSYNQFFMFEVFMKTYQTLQDWVSVFPPLSSSTQYSMNNVIRPHDLLGAQRDVETLFSSMQSDSAPGLAAKLVVFPSQSLAAYGIKETFDSIAAKAQALSVNAPFTDLTTLDDKKYLPLMTGVAMSSLNMSHDVTKVVLLDKIVAEEVKLALADLVPSLVRGSSKMTIATLEALQLRSPIPFVIPRAMTNDISRGAEFGVWGNTLHYDSGTPRFSWDYHKHIRDTYSYKVLDEESVMTSFTDKTRSMAINRDRADQLRELFGIGWKSLMPSNMANGPVLITKAQLKADDHAVRNLIENVTGSHYDIVIRELGVEHLRKMWATYFSSFAILYYNASEEKASDTNLPVLVEGWGKPYGKAYSSLASLQGDSVKLDDLISIGQGGYIRLLTKVPVITDELQYSSDYYMSHPAFFYASNSASVEGFSGWVMEESLLHLSMVPVSINSTIPKVILSNKFAYLTNSIYINTDLYFKPDAPSATRENVAIPYEKRNWPFERYSFYLDYINFGAYGSNTVAEFVENDDPKIADVIKKIESQMDEDQKEQSQDKSKVDNQSKIIEEAVVKEVKDSNDKKFVPADDEANAI